MPIAPFRLLHAGAARTGRCYGVLVAGELAFVVDARDQGAGGDYNSLGTVGDFVGAQ